MSIQYGQSVQVPRIGMFATVRNRRGVTTGIEPYDGPNGRLHIVHVEYKDDQLPRDEKLIWELEPASRLLEPTALPNTSNNDPMPAEEYDALLRSARWSAATPFIDPDSSGPLDRLPFASPFHGAVQVDDFQLVPLLKALRMPRVNLLLADDVGLGKTVEAGLILTELLLRRRVQRVLILTPAALRLQWRDEMRDKFSLGFDLVDRDETHALRRRLGMDANPWRSFSRIIASYHYLRQDDVLGQFLAACRTPEGSPHLPWDLLIVDECHNLMPSAFGDDSDLCRMLRLLAPQFEHRLFLSATPHNGHTRCFTGLLEILDPVRFSQTDQLREAERGRVQQVVIRRLKREINARTNPPKFCTRLAPQALVLSLTPQDVLMQFETSRTAPIAAMRAALDSKEEMLPVFLAEFERASHTPWEDLPHADSYGIMLEILGQWADPRSYLPLARFFRLNGDTLDALLGDGITETADRVMAGVATTDLTPIFEIILDENADLFVRSGMISAILRIAVELPERRPDVVTFIEEFRSRLEPDADPYLIAQWAFAVAVLGLKHLEADARATIAAYPSEISCYSPKDFDDDLRETREDPSGSWFMRDATYPTAINAIEEVSRWHCYSEEYISQMEREEREGSEHPYPWDEADIAFNPYRDVGRNDPCPCGSGKKYKKCCLN